MRCLPTSVGLSLVDVGLGSGKWTYGVSLQQSNALYGHARMFTKIQCVHIHNKLAVYVVLYSAYQFISLSLSIAFSLSLSLSLSL